MIFLLAGPATNLATIAVIRGFLGGRVLAAYLFSIAAFSLLCGTLLGPLYGIFGMDPAASMSGAVEDGLGWIDITGGIVVLYLLVHSARRLGLHRRWWRNLSNGLSKIGIHTSSNAIRFLGFSTVLLAYLSTAIHVVNTGEVGFLTRYGRVVQTLEEPGVVLHLPYPFDQFESLRTKEIRGAQVGFAEETDSLSRVREANKAIEITTGDETLLQVPFAVHYVISNAYRQRYEIGDSSELIVALSTTALQRAASRRTTNEILVDARQTLEVEVAEILETELDSIQSGLDVVAVRIGSIHAPEEVHEAFRDVASALEDKERFEHEAEAYRIGTLTKARGTAASVLEDAQAYAASVTKESQGRAVAFQSFLKAYQEDPKSTLLRMQLDTLPRSLKGARVIFQLGEDVDIVNLPPSIPDEEGEE